MTDESISELYAQAKELQDQGKDKEALQMYRKILSINPKFVQAETQVNEILTSHEKRHMQHANLYTAKGQHEEAIREYNELLDLNPNIWKARKNLAQLYQKAGIMNKAIIEIKKAITLAPELCGLHLTLAKFCDIQGNYPLALQEYQKALRLNPGDAFIKKHVEIAQQISDFFANKPDTTDPFLLVDIGNLFLEKEMPEKAIEFFAKAHDLAKRNQEILVCLARAHYRLKNLESAVQFFSLALAITPPTVNLEDIYYYLGLCYSGLNQHKEALDALHSCVNTAPKSRTAQRAQANITVIQNYLKGIPTEQ